MSFAMNASNDTTERYPDDESHTNAHTDNSDVNSDEPREAGLLGDEDDVHMRDALSNLPDSKNDQQDHDNDDDSLKSVPLLEAELAKTKDQLLRALAEAENTRKRAQREKEDATSYAITKFARDILSVSDNLSRALESTKNHNGDEALKSLIEGVEITEKDLQNVLSKHKVQKIEALDQPFDHNWHEAMVEIPSDEHEPGVVIHEMQVGYRIGDRLLRPSMVGVSKSKE